MFFSSEKEVDVVVLTRMSFVLMVDLICLGCRFSFGHEGKLCSIWCCYSLSSRVANTRHVAIVPFLIFILWGRV